MMTIKVSLMMTSSSVINCSHRTLVLMSYWMMMIMIVLIIILIGNFGRCRFIAIVGSATELCRKNASTFHTELFVREKVKLKEKKKKQKQRCKQWIVHYGIYGRSSFIWHTRGNGPLEHWTSSGVKISSISLLLPRKVIRHEVIHGKPSNPFCVFKRSAKWIKKMGKNVNIK